MLPNSSSKQLIKGFTAETIKQDHDGGLWLGVTSQTGLGWLVLPCQTDVYPPGKSYPARLWGQVLCSRKSSNTADSTYMSVLKAVSKLDTYMKLLLLLTVCGFLLSLGIIRLRKVHTVGKVISTLPTSLQKTCTLRQRGTFS